MCKAVFGILKGFWGDGGTNEVLGALEGFLGFKGLEKGVPGSQEVPGLPNGKNVEGNY